MIPCWLEAASAAGQAVGGVATAVGVVFAFREVGRWKEQRITEKRADVAGQCYVALSHALSQTELWAFTMAESATLNATSQAPILVWAEEAWTRGFAWANPAMEALKAVQPLAETYLSASAREPIEAATRLWFDMWIQHGNLASEPVGSAEELVAKVKAFAQFQARANAITEQAKKHLLPDARFET